jgi:hypothetical protein
MQQAPVILALHDPTSWLDKPDALRREYLMLDPATLIVLTPPAIFVFSGIIWYWMNELS